MIFQFPGLAGTAQGRDLDRLVEHKLFAPETVQARKQGPDLASHPGKQLEVVHLRAVFQRLEKTRLILGTLEQVIEPEAG